MNNETLKMVMELKAQGLSDELIIAMLNTKAPRGGKGKAQSDKPNKVYEHFEKSFDGFCAKSYESKGGNPDAVLKIEFNGIPEDKVRNYLKGCGFKYNATEKVWYRDNCKFAQKCLELVNSIE